MPWRIPNFPAARSRWRTSIRRRPWQPRKKKDLAFIYTDKATTCGLCQGAAAAFIDAVKSKTVIVYVDSTANQTWWPKLPEPVRQALTPGKFIPKIVVTDPTAAKVTASLTYEAYKEDDRKAIRGLKTAMKGE